MGQKADVVLVFQAVGIHEFTIEHGKNRSPGGHKEPRARFRIVDTEDGNLDIEPMGKHIDERVAEAAGAAEQLIVEAGEAGIGRNLLRAALYEMGFGGNTVDRAFAELRQEDPPRVKQVSGPVVGADGKRRTGRPWVPATNQTQPDPK